MKNLFFAITLSAIFFTFFFVSDNNFSKGYNKRVEAVEDSLNSQALIQVNNEVMRSLEQKVENMEKYIDAGQKNLDAWLKVLATFLSVVIAASIFNGLKTHDRAKEELANLKTIGEEIKILSNGAKTRLKRLKKITDLITQVENTASNTKKLEGEAREKLNEFASKENIVLNDAQTKTLDETIAKTKEELQKSGIEAFKNLYFAKALKAEIEMNWEEVIRLLNTYIDLDDSNSAAFLKRGLAYQKQGLKDPSNADTYNDKSILNNKEAIRIRPDFASALTNLGNGYYYKKNFTEALTYYEKALQAVLNNINRYTGNTLTEAKLLQASIYFNTGNAYYHFEKHSEALSNYDAAILLNTERADYYYQRYLTFNKLGRQPEGLADIKKAKELDPAKYNNKPT